MFISTAKVKPVPYNFLACAFCEMGRSQRFTGKCSNSFPAKNYMFKGSSRNSRKRCQIYSKLTIKTQHQNRLFSNLIVVLGKYMLGWDQSISLKIIKQKFKKTFLFVCVCVCVCCDFALHVFGSNILRAHALHTPSAFIPHETSI